MYIHIGEKKSVRERYVVGIFDLDGETTTTDTAAFLKRAEKDGIVSTATGDIPKSFVLCSDKKGEEVFLSHISSKSLRERAEVR